MHRRIVVGESRQSDESYETQRRNTSFLHSCSKPCVVMAGLATIHVLGSLVVVRIADCTGSDEDFVADGITYAQIALIGCWGVLGVGSIVYRLFVVMLCVTYLSCLVSETIKPHGFDEIVEM